MTQKDVRRCEFAQGEAAHTPSQKLLQSSSSLGLATHELHDGA